MRVVSLLVIVALVSGAILNSNNINAQPGALGTNNIVSSGFNCVTLTDLGAFRQARLLAGTNSTGTYEFPELCNFSTGNVWRPYSGGSAQAVFNAVLAPNPGGNFGALYNGGNGGSSGNVAAVTSGRYYTFNIQDLPPANNLFFSILETTYNPVAISAVTSAWGNYGTRVVTVTAAAAPASGENVYVRYTTDNYASSILIPVTFVGTTGTATIPTLAQNANVSFYVYTSNKSIAAINTDVANHGQLAHDLNTLNLGAGGSYAMPNNPVIVTSSAGSAAGVATGYATLGAAFTAINVGPAHLGVITIAINGNTSEGATTATLNQVTGVTSIGIQPTGGVARTISGGTTAGNALINFNGADNVTIDGLNTGGNSLTISNTTVAATSGTATIRFVADAINNVITNCSILGSSTTAIATNGGNIIFGAGAISTGNDNNTISNCNIGPAGSNLPTKGVYFSGTTTSTALNNSGISITNNNIFDFFSATSPSAGIYATNGTTDIIISNNRFYQTAARTMTDAQQHSAIWITNTSGNNYQVTNNTIGFANSSGTGTYSFSGILSSNFIPVFMSVGSTTASSINFNTIAGIAISGSMAGTSSSAPFRGIYISAGLTECNSNVIGSMSANGSITFTSSSASTSDVIGIFNFGSANWTTNSNQIGGITSSNSGTGACNIYGLRCNTGSGVNWTCTNNIVGGTIANSINSNTTATGTIVNGILNSNPNGTITGNTVRNLTAAGGTGTSASAAVGGIVISASSANHTVQNNTIHNLRSTLNGAGNVIGINFGGSSGANLVDRNFIYALDGGNSTTAVVHGINIVGGTTTYSNNMIRLGTFGNSANVGMAINGINETIAGTNNLWHNSIYIGGAPANGASNTFALQSSITTNTRNYQNNIFFNARSNNGATSKHYAIRVGGTSANPTGLVSNYNLLFVSGTGGVLGLFNGTDRATLADWQTATGQDLSSIIGNPQFIAPTSATPDLHISTSVPTPIEAAGTNVASVTVDFDNQTRSTLSPVDIGADAGNFIAQDVSAPNISYTILPANNCGLGDVVLSGVTITDATGLPSSPSLATSADRPRIYFRKSAGTWFSNAGTLVSGTATNSTWDFTISAATMGGVSANDIIQYYVIAQDAASTPNVGSNPLAGLIASGVNSVTTHPSAPNSFTSLAILNGTYTVGVGGDYTTLTAAVNAYNTQCLGGPVVFSLIDNAYPSETFPIVINANAQASLTNTLTIKPAVGTTPTISGSATPNLIRLDGADFVTIDGSNTVSGTTKDLTISNTNTGGTAVTFINDASNNAIRNTILRSVNNNNTTGTVLIGGGVTTGNDNITIDNCDLAPGATTPWNAIWSSTGSSTVRNGNITINNCNIYDFFSPTGTQAGVNLNLGNNAWTITNNRIYQTTTRTFTGGSTVQPIRIADTNTGSEAFNVSGNVIGFNSQNGTGTWTQTSSANKFQGIYVATNDNGAVSTIANNIISNVSVSSTDAGSGNSSPFAGIIANTGRWDINNNTVGNTGSTTLSFTTSNTATSEVLGIYNFSSAATTIDDNVVSGLSLTNSSTGSIVFQGILSSTAPGVTATITDNTIGASSAGIVVTASGTSSRALGISATTASLIIANNSISNLTMSAANTGANNNASMIGISCTASGSQNHSIGRNTIFNLNNTASSGATSVTGIYYSGFTGINTVERNTIHSLSCASNTGIISGIETDGTGVLNVSNNMIRLGINASGNSIQNSAVIYGIRKGSTAVQNFYYNSVYVGGTVVGTGSINTFAFARTTGTSADNVRNNIFANLRSNATTGGLHYSVNLSSATNVLLGNNLYQFNSGSFARINTTTVSAYSSNWAGGDANSAVGNPNFINPTGDAASVNLRINPTGGSAAESIGVEIAGITSDIDALNVRPAGGYPLPGQVNGGGTAPDAGADEGDFELGGDTTPPSFTYTAIPNTCETTDRVISGVVITDGGAGLPASPSLATSATRPRIYYRKNAGTWFSNGGTYVSGTANSSTWDFTILVTDMGGVIGGDNIEYYIIAQDDAGSPNITAVPGMGFAATSVNNITTHPTNPNVYSVTPTLSGTYTVGTGGDYSTLTAAVNAYNTSCLGGAVIFSLTDAAYTGETYPITINANVNASATNTLTIKPTQSATTFSGTSSSALIVLNGADYVIIDGSTGNVVNSVCPEVYATRNLTFTNNFTSATSAVIWLQTATGPNPATNNIIRNCNIIGNSTTTTLVGIGSGSTAISTTSAGNGNNNNTFENNNISRVQIGIQSRGTSNSNKTEGTVINNNQINSAAPNNVLLAGVHVGFENNITISRNNIGNIGLPALGMVDGFGIAGGSLSITNTSFTGNEVTNATVSYNTLNNIRGTSDYTAIGIFMAPTTNTGTNNIINNMISNVATSGSAGDFGAGLFIGGGAGTHNIHYNTIYTNNTTANSGSGINFGIAIGGSNPIVNLRNNSVSVTTGAQTTGAPTRAIGLAYSTYTNLSSNNNAFFASGGNTTASGLAIVGSLSNILGTTQATFAAWQTTTSQDANSLNFQFVPVSGTDLHAIPASNIPLNGAGAVVSTTVDFDCATRNASTPDIGADEFDVPQNDAGVTAIAPTNPCAGTNTLGVTVFNFGGNPITSVDLNFSVNGGSTSTQSFTSLNIAPGNSTVLNLTGVIFTNALAAQSITVSTSNPNGAIDPTAANDTFSNNALLIALNGTYTVGATGDFTTITDAVNRANASGLCGPVTFSLIDASYTSETFPITINALVGSNATNTLTIKPTGTSEISGTSASAMFVLNGADNIIIDGSASSTTNTDCPLVTASRDLTITNTSTSASSAVIWLQSLGAGAGATNNIIRNTNLIGGSSTGTFACVGQGSSTISSGSTGEDNDNNRFENNRLSRAQYGVFSQGAGTTNYNTGTVIQLNATVPTATNNISRAGVYVGFEDGAIVRKNTIINISGNTTDAYGISAGLTTVSVSNPGGNQSINLLIDANTITTVRSNSSSAMGIALSTVTAAGPNRIFNNMISDVLNTVASPDYGSGILVGGDGATGSTQVYNNTVSMTGTATGTGVRNYAISIQGSNNPIVDLRNNIFVNTVVSSATFTGGIPNGTTCIGLAYNSPFTNLTSNNNAFFVNAGGNIGSFSGLTNANPLATLSAWQSTIGVDANSISGTNPAFVSATDLHLDAANTSNYIFNGAAANITSITVDIDCETRTNPYDLGADEILVPNCSDAVGGTATAATSLICGTSGSTTITATGFSPLFVGISYSWEASNDGSTGWTATGQNNPTSFNTGTISATRYYRLAVTCSFGSITNYSNVVTVAVAPVPTATASANSPACVNGDLNLTGTTDIGATYSWTGPNSYSSTLQNPTISGISSANAGLYSFTATSAAGCVSLPSAILVEVISTPPTPSITPSSATICDGDNVVLSAATAGVNGNVIQGSGASTTSGSSTLSTLGPNPLQNYYGGSKQQMLFTAAELTALGFVPGTRINSIGIHMNSVNTSYALQNLVVKVGHTSATELATAWISGLSTVRPAASYTLNTGVNVLTFTTPFFWNGNSNLVVEINYSNNNTGATATFNTATFDNTGTTTTTRFYRADNVTATAVDAYVGAPSFTYTSRNRVTFNTTTSYTYAWTPTTGLTPATGIGASVNAAPNTTTTYTVTATNLTGCTSTNTATINVNPRPTAVISGTTSICSGASTSLTIAVTGTGTISGQLSNGATFSGTAPSITVSVSPTTTTTYTVTSLTDANCAALAGDLTSSATITVNPIVVAEVGISADQSFPICQGTSVTFTAAPVNGGATPSYAWFLNNNPVGSNAPTYTNASLTDGDIVRVEMTTSNPCAEPTTVSSTNIVVTVNPLLTWYLDADGDGYSTGATLQSCTQPTNYVLLANLFATTDDCNDSNDDINPGMEEFCNGIDDDCDLAIDEGLTNLTYYIDADGDGFGNPAITQVACTQPSGYVLNNTDCNDGNANIYPGATEQCNGINDDCDAQTDEGCGVINDEPFTALILWPGNLGSCSNYFGTLAGASASAASSNCAEIQAAGGTSADCPISGEDVWYYFTATSNGVSIVCNAANNDVTIELHNDVGGLLAVENARTGNGQERLNYSGLTEGETYYVAIRNYNSAVSVGGSFQLCVQRLRASRLNIPTSGVVLRCNALNANWTNANQYIFRISPTLTINGTYAANVGGSGNTILPIANNPNFQYGAVFPNVTVDAVYAVPNGMGVLETIVVPGIETANLVIEPQPSLQLRTLDACPNARTLNTFISFAGNFCGPVIDYQWEFTQTAPAAGLPVVENTITTSRWIRVNQIPGVQLGATYDVRIRPVYAGGIFGSWSTVPSCLQIIGPANSPVVKEDETAQVFYRNAEQELDELGAQVNVYPNPSNGDALAISLNGFVHGKTSIRIIDNIGKVYFQQTYHIEHDNSLIQPEMLSTPRAGIYFIEIIDNDGKVFTKKWMVAG